MHRNKWFRRAAVCLLWILGAAWVFSQGNTGRLEGTVLDPSGGIVPNAAVTLTSQATGQKYTATTDAAGNFAVAALPGGSYQISVQVTGFKTYQQNVTIDPGAVANARITLETGEVTQTV